MYLERNSQVIVFNAITCSVRISNVAFVKSGHAYLESTERQKIKNSDKCGAPSYRKFTTLFGVKNVVEYQRSQKGFTEERIYGYSAELFKAIEFEINKKKHRKKVNDKIKELYFAELSDEDIRVLYKKLF